MSTRKFVPMLFSVLGCKFYLIEDCCGVTSFKKRPWKSIFLTMGHELQKMQYSTYPTWDIKENVVTWASIVWWETNKKSYHIAAWVPITRNKKKKSRLVIEKRDSAHIILQCPISFIITQKITFRIGRTCYFGIAVITSALM